MKNQNFQRNLSIVKEAIKRKKYISHVCTEKGLDDETISDYMRRLDSKLKNGTITKKEYQEINNSYEQYLDIKDGFGRVVMANAKGTPKSKKPIKFEDLTEDEKAEVVYDAWADDNYDDRSKGEALRDKKGKITGYTYKILIRGQKPLEGEFSRENMDSLYSLYTANYGSNLTIREVSRHFPNLTFRDFKRILRAFNITKSSIPCAPHLLEEQSSAEIAELVLRRKEDNLFKALEQERDKFFEKAWIDANRKLVELKNAGNNIKDALKGLSVKDIVPFKINKKQSKNKAALFVYLSDMHVGADTVKDSVYKNNYNEQELNKRLSATLQKLKEQYDTFGRFEKLIVLNMGDALDGYDKKTTRGGHSLPQNMNNKEQFNVYVTAMLKFFETLYDLNIANEIEFVSTGNDNHSGDAGYIANKSIEYIFKYKYPEMKVTVQEKFIGTVEWGQHTIIYTHGKDKENMKSGFPLHLDAKTETYFNEFINNYKIMTPYIHVVKGDLHQTTSQQGKRFRYKNVSSLYGSSDWIHTNFGYTRPAVDFEIVFKDSGTVLEGTIDLR